MSKATKISLWRDETSGGDQWVVSADHDEGTHTIACYDEYEPALARARRVAAERSLPLVECDEHGVETELDEPRTAYRLYYAPEGGDISYCGEYETESEAIEAADRDPRGLECSLWDTARAAGHVAGMHAPDGNGSEAENGEWCGPDGHHHVVAVTYESEAR